MEKRIDGTYTINQVVPDSKKKTLWITSARIEKAAVGSQVPNDSNTIPQPTSKTPLVSSSASNNIVSQDNDIVNNSVRNNKGNDTFYAAKNKPDLKVGDIIEAYGKEWRVTKTGFNMSFENLDKSDKESVFSHIGGMDNFKATHDYKLVSDDTPSDVDVTPKTSEKYRKNVLKENTDSGIMVENDQESEAPANETMRRTDSSIRESGDELQREKSAGEIQERTDRNNAGERDVQRRGESGIESRAIKDVCEVSEFAKKEVSKPFEKEKELAEALEKQKDITYRYEHYGLENAKYSISESEDFSSRQAETNIFSAHSHDVKQYEEQINAWSLRKMKPNELFRLGNTPIVLEELGAKKLPVTMSQKVMNKITGGKHDISLDELKKLPNAIADPIMVFKSATVDDAFVVLTELADKQGNDAVVAMHLNRNDGFNTINRISSVYGKENIGNFVEKHIKNDNLKYVEKNKSQEWLRSRGLQLPKLNTVLNSNNSILRKENIVNNYFAKNNEKYSESEGFINEQSGSNLLSGNSGRAIDESAGKQAKRVSSYKQRLEGKTTTERKSTAKELAVKGYTEEVVNGNHKYTLIKEDGYNDDMRSIVSEAKAYGKEVGFFIGNAVRKFDGQRNFNIDGIKLTDNKILIRYDGTYSPQALLMHELVHTEWNNPEMQKAKDIILSDLSESDKQEILQNGRYKDYMELYNGDEDAVWEEFIADIFADMNDYSEAYIDTAVDYWYNDKVTDRYKPSEYIKSIDTGGNEAVLNNVGFGNEYSLSGNSFDIPYNEKRQLDDYVLRKNHSGNKLEKVDCKEIGNNFYVWENNSKTDYNVVNMIEIDGNEDLIDEYREGVKNGNFRRTKRFNEWSANVRNRRGTHTVLNADAERTATHRSNGGLSSRQSESNTVGRSKESGRDKQTKYALNSYDTDSESLTPERKKAIFEQWEKDHAGLEKPTKRQLWGERAQWVAHNATRVFPNIPERGEKGTFFAEFRKDMIQWKNLPTTASFMVQDKLNKMTEGLTPEEFKTFSELVYFLDLQEEAQIQKERGYDEILLPNEITPKEVDEIVNVLNEEATDKVQQALIKRQNIWDELKQQYIDLNSYIGFDTDGKFKRKNYYHHQVIDYMNNDKGGTGSREIGIKAGRGWLKERQGSTKAINTDFLAVEYKAMMQMQYDVYIAETLGKIKQQYDIKPKLEKEAFEHNKKALNDIIQKECTDKGGNVMLDKSGKPDSETYRKQKWYNARIMWGFNGLFDLAERGELGDYEGEYTNVIEAFKKHDLNASGLYKYVGILSNIELPDNATRGYG